MVRKFTRPVDLARHKEMQLRKLWRGSEAEFDQIVRDSLQDGINLTGGSIRQKTLNKLGNPFGRGPRPNSFAGGGLKRGSRTKIPNLPINMQSGRLRRSWYVQRQGNTWKLGNRAPHAKFILSPWGTRKMVGREIWGHPSKAVGAPIGLMARYARARLKALVNTMRRRTRSIL